MQQLDIFKRAGKNLRQAKTRTALTSLAIGVGALTISLAMAAGVGGRAFTEEMVNTSGDIYSLNVYPRFEAPDESSEELPEFGVVSAQATEVRRMTDKDIAQIRTLGGVESINPMLSISAQYATRGEGYPKRIAPL